MTTEFSHRIIELPLFLGLSQSEITAIMGHTRFGFTQVAEGMPVVKEHDACSHLYFLRKGTLRVETVADDHGYRLVEEVGAPTLLQPEHLFGLHQHYTSTFTAQTDCQFITLEKSEVIRLTTEFTIFRLNFFNLLTTKIQNGNEHYGILLLKHSPDVLPVSSAPVAKTPKARRRSTSK